MMIKKTGWSTRGRPFSPKEFASSHIKKNFKLSYQGYLKIWLKAYANPKHRRSLIN